eukprot:703055-Prorocentrum_minimum.AAC.4
MSSSHGVVVHKPSPPAERREKKQPPEDPFDAGDFNSVRSLAHSERPLLLSRDLQKHKQYASRLLVKTGDLSCGYARAVLDYMRVTPWADQIG